jgi:choloylglycine hydrolase
LPAIATTEIVLENQSSQPVFPVIRDVFMPYCISATSPISRPWSTVSDHQRKLCFSNRPTSHAFRASLKALDFDLKTDKVMKLELGADQSHASSGNATAELPLLAALQFLGTRSSGLENDQRLMHQRWSLRL